MREARQIDPGKLGSGSVLFMNEAQKRERRLNSRLLEEEFEQFDMAAIQAAEERLVVISDLRDAGLVRPLGGLGVMKSTFTKLDAFSAAEQSMDGRSRDQEDAPEVDQTSVPVPITFKDFEIGMRELDASRRFGQALDDSAVAAGTRQVSELLEDTVLNGGSVTVGGDSIPGFTNEANRNTVALATNWDALTDLTLILADVLAMIQAANDANHFGPFWLYVPGNYSSTIEDDLKAESDLTVRQRLEAINSIQRVRVADRLTDDNVVLVQATSDVVDLAVANDIEVIERDVTLDMAVAMKVFAAMAPRVKADFAGNSGVVHLS